MRFPNRVLDYGHGVQGDMPCQCDSHTPCTNKIIIGFPQWHLVVSLELGIRKRGIRSHPAHFTLHYCRITAELWNIMTDPETLLSLSLFLHVPNAGHADDLISAGCPGDRQRNVARGPRCRNDKGCDWCSGLRKNV